MERIVVSKLQEATGPRTKHIVIWDEVDEEGYWTRGLQEEYSDWQEALARTEHLRKIDWCQNIDMVTMGE